MKKRKALLFCIILCILSLGTMTIALVTHSQVQAVFTPPAFDHSAQTGTPTPPEELKYTPVEVEDGYHFSVCAQPTEKNGKVQIYFTSETSNTVWMKLQIYNSSGTMVGETGVIRPGEYVQELPLTKTVDAGEEIHLKVIGYTPETWYSAGNVELKTQLLDQ